MSMLNRLKTIWNRIRFGTITERVVCHIDMSAAEIEYTGRRGRRVGYWAYGYFDPNLPYQG